MENFVATDVLAYTTVVFENLGSFVPESGLEVLEGCQQREEYGKVSYR